MNDYLRYIQELPKGQEKRVVPKIIRRILFRLLSPYFARIASLVDHSKIDLNQSRHETSMDIERIELKVTALQNRLIQLETKKVR
jgi:hypothetical protein